MRARRLSAVALAFVLALAVFAATRGDERAAAGPPGAHAPREAQLSQAAARAAKRHHFRKAERLARRARSLAPDSAAAYAVLVDALVELGRYREAERTLQRMVELKPNLSSYARVSYFRELTGDLDGAAEALRLAVAAGGPTPRVIAQVQSLLGSLELVRGRPGAARRAYAAASATAPGFPAALDGRARLAAYRGQLGAALALWRKLTAQRALPEYAIALGEAELAAGHAAAGRAHLERGRELFGVEASRGFDIAVELAVFEADHGDRAGAVQLAREAWRLAPSVRSADALGWALTRSGDARDGLRWTRRALRLGSLDPLFRFHAGVAALAAGDRGEGRHHLRVALGHGLAAHPWHGNQARAALERR